MKVSGSNKRGKVIPPEGVRVGFLGGMRVCSTLKDRVPKDVADEGSRLSKGTYKRAEGIFWNCKKSSVTGA